VEVGGRVIRLEECTAEWKASFVEIRLKLRRANPLFSLPRIPFNLRGGEISTLRNERIPLCESSMRSSFSIARSYEIEA